MKILPLFAYIFLYSIYRYIEYSSIGKTGFFERKSSWEWSTLLIILPYTAVITLPAVEFLFLRTNINSVNMALGAILFAASSAVKIRAYKDIGSSYSACIEKPDAIVKKGIYSKIRHPEYLSDIILYAACPLFLNSVFSWYASMLGSAAILLRIILEERFLASNSSEYSDYMKKTKTLIPYLF